ncbi:hypothetical protein BGZ74_000878 [Mortierella antarctica]|nr:hypothetical protein BGZ74_000878 [Mortierella antarctica]
MVRAKGKGAEMERMEDKWLMTAEDKSATAFIIYFNHRQRFTAHRVYRLMLERSQLAPRVKKGLHTSFERWKQNAAKAFWDARVTTETTSVYNLHNPQAKATLKTKKKKKKKKEEEEEEKKTKKEKKKKKEEEEKKTKKKKKETHPTSFLESPLNMKVFKAFFHRHLIKCKCVGVDAANPVPIPSFNRCYKKT